MLRKLIVFAITSGLAKKAWDHYRSGRRDAVAPVAKRPPSLTDQNAAMAQAVTPVSPMHYN